MRMNDYVRLLVGKTIKGVVVRDRETKNPPRQLFLIFPDDSVFEIYGEFTWGKGFTSEGFEGIMESEGDGVTRLVECDVRISR